jgi:hypothetical protein
VARTLQDSENGRARKMRCCDILFDGISEGRSIFSFDSGFGRTRVRNLKRVRKVEDSTDLMSCGTRYDQ